MVARGRCSRGYADADIYDSLVRGAQRQVQKSDRVQQRPGRGPKPLVDGLHRDHRRPLAFLVTTHAITGDEQRSLFPDLGDDAVLIGVTCAPEAEFGVFNAQAGSMSLG